MATAAMSLFDQASDLIMELFDYNRENFQTDRRQRQIMEYEIAEMRIKQTELWRDDVRDLADLTPEKIEVYLLIIALELGFCVMALCKGRVPPGAPPWLVACHTLAVCGALMYLILALWFGMHAFVSAQAYKVRILTQLVRLPIPSWRAMEASRTYSSAFEKIDKRQLLRVPFAMGRQERLASARRGGRRGESEAPLGPGSSLSGRAGNEEAAPADPWGLERRGDSISEIAPEVNTQTERQKHIWLAREAAKFYQTYDAFCRISMSAGTSSLAMFFCYFCLSYVLTENAAPPAAWAGMAVFLSCSLVIMRSDLLLGSRQYLTLSFLKFASPCISAVVTFRSSKNSGDPGNYEYLMPLALFIHGFSELYYLYLFRLREVQSGAMIPMAFRVVLFLDPFAWAKHTGSWHKKLRRQLMLRNAMNTSSRAFTSSRSFSLRRPSFIGSTSSFRFGPLNTSGGSSRTQNESSASLSTDASGGPRSAAALPTMECVDGLGPCRPEDVDAAREEVASSSSRPVRSSSVSFRPGTFAVSGRDETTLSQDDRADVQTGTDIHGEKPGLVPARVFFCNTLVLVALWWWAAGVALMNARKGAAVFVQPTYGLEEGVVAPMVDFHQREAPRNARLPGQRLLTDWGNSTFVTKPHGLACSADGTLFATLGPTSDGRRGILQGRLVPEAHGSRQIVKFEPGPPCPALTVAKEPVQDLAMRGCTVEADNTTCEILLMPKKGRRLLSCEMSNGQAAQAQSIDGVKGLSALPLGRRWLDDRGGEPVPGERPAPGHAEGLLHPEELVSMVVAPCPNARQVDDCLVVGTTARRVVQLGPGSDSWVPKRLLNTEHGEVPQPGSFALLSNRYLAVIERGTSVLHVSDLQRGGAPVGTWFMPTPGAGANAHWAAVCAGGGAFYAIEGGDAPTMWRFEAPKSLSPRPAVQPRVGSWAWWPF